MKDWAVIARCLIETERSRAPFLRPPLTPTIFSWRGEYHYGGIQGPILAEEPSVFFITKTSEGVPRSLIDAIVTQQPTRLQLDVDGDIDFIGRQHILQRIDCKLTTLTPVQMLLAKRWAEHTLIIDTIL